MEIREYVTDICFFINQGPYIAVMILYICQVVRINRTAKKIPFAVKFLSPNPEELKNVKVEIGGTGIS